MRITFLKSVLEQVHEGKYAENCRRLHFTGLLCPGIGNEHPLSSPISPSTFLASSVYCVSLCICLFCINCLHLHAFPQGVL
ncbi:hypothetical protein TNIN_93541 [Trichonephila inaurata madagascariensis]|uniref:Uncharacterized protein n=1 Tax=Trichonephila inaurata madagascariensis TaxID=2747483 RepID=A0A8X6WW08_9ARAC|nr:hypothetical protein TNIN_93541 [Trichonephila inaurata madagascariensis]